MTMTKTGTFTRLVAVTCLAVASAPLAPIVRAAPAAADATTTLANSLRALQDGENAAPRDHWDPKDVEAQLGHDPGRTFAWGDWDFVRAPGGAADRTVEPANLPDDLYHRITLRVVAEKSEGDATTETVVLEHAWHPALTIRQPISLVGLGGAIGALGGS